MELRSSSRHVTSDTGSPVSDLCVMVFYTTFNNISVISWQPVLLMEETESTRRKPLARRKSDKLDHIMLHRVHERLI